jgi:hypothetical protein
VTFVDAEGNCALIVFPHSHTKKKYYRKIEESYSHDKVIRVLFPWVLTKENDAFDYTKGKDVSITTNVSLSGAVSTSATDLTASVGLSYTTTTLESTSIHPKITNKKKKWARLVVIADVSKYKALYCRDYSNYDWFGKYVGYGTETKVAGTITTYNAVAVRIQYTNKKY